MFTLIVDGESNGYFADFADAVQQGRQDARDYARLFGDESVTVEIYELVRTDKFVFSEDGGIIEQETI